MEGTCEGGLQSHLLLWGWGWEGTSYLLGGGDGLLLQAWKFRRRVCVVLVFKGLPPVSLVMSGMQVFPRDSMPAGQACLVECSVSLWFSQSCRILG